MKKFIFLTATIFFILSSLTFADISDGLVFYLSFDNCDATDYSGNGYNGKMYGDIKCIEGKYGKALYLPTSKEYIGIEKEYTIEDFTLSFWIKLDEKAGSNSSHSYNMFLQGANEHSKAKFANEFNFAIRDGDNALEICWNENKYSEPCHHSKGIDIFDKKFHHIVYVKKGTTVKIYIDGKYFYTYPSTNFEGMAYVQYTVIGQDQDCYKDCFDKDQIMKGAIDELRLYKRALSEDEILQLYNYSQGLCSQEELNKKYQEGFEAGKKFCIENPDKCKLDSNIISPVSTGSCATFDMATQIFHVPCFSTGEKKYDLYFHLESVKPNVMLKLIDVK